MARARRQADDPSVFQVYSTGCAEDTTAGKYNTAAPANRPVLAERLYQGMLAAWKATQRRPLETDRPMLEGRLSRRVLLGAADDGEADDPIDGRSVERQVAGLSSKPQFTSVGPAKQRILEREDLGQEVWGTQAIVRHLGNGSPCSPGRRLSHRPHATSRASCSP